MKAYKFRHLISQFDSLNDSANYAEVSIDDVKKHAHAGTMSAFLIDRFGKNAAWCGARGFGTQPRARLGSCGEPKNSDEAPAKTKMEASGFLSPGAPNLTLRLLEFRAVALNASRAEEFP